MILTVFYKNNFITAVRNEKNEEKAKRAYEAEYEKKVEAFYARAQYEQQRYRRDDPSEVINVIK